MRRTFEYVVLRDLTVSIEGAGSGTVSGDFLGQTVREVGQDYVIIAKPAAGSRFVGWRGGMNASEPRLRFTMAEGMQIVAVFEPK